MTEQKRELLSTLMKDNVSQNKTMENVFEIVKAFAGSPNADPGGILVLFDSLLNFIETGENPYEINVEG